MSFNEQQKQRRSAISVKSTQHDKVSIRSTINKVLHTVQFIKKAEDDFIRVIYDLYKVT